ncbi:HAD family hydrolase [Candidatus Woesebacteria bacterium]|nr:MAG: HAD family hydrolase [Candidatus Woesebacteria bacterium]
MKKYKYCDVEKIMSKKLIYWQAIIDKRVEQTFSVPEKINSITGDLFLIDGSPIIDKKSFAELPDWLRKYFLSERIMPVVDREIWLNNSSESSDLHTREGAERFVALRGPKFYNFDGKFEWGPNGIHALSMLRNNLTEDGDILVFLDDFKPSNVSEWLAKLASLFYIINDVVVAYYLIACKSALTNSVQNDDYNKLLNMLYKEYFDLFLLLDITKTNLDQKNIQYRLESLIKDLLTTVETVENYPELDLIRSHREAASPISLLFALHVFFKTRRLEDVDLVLAPLYGGIDVAMALRYVFQNREYLAKYLGQSRVHVHCDNIEIINVLTRIVKMRPLRRSEIADLKSENNAIDIEPNEQLVNKINNANKIMLMDDSVGKFETYDKFRKWLKKHLTKNVDLDFVAVYANIKWAKDNNIRYEKFLTLEALAVSPVSDSFLGKDSKYKLNGPYIPEKIINLSLMQCERTFINFNELQEYLVNLHDHKIIEGVGFDLYETLVERPGLNKNLRSNSIHNTHKKVFEYFQLGNKYNLFSSGLKELWGKEKKAKEIAYQEIDYIMIIEEVVRKAGVEKNVAPKLARMLLDKEMQMEINFTKPRKGLIKMLKNLKKKRIQIAIFTNTHYSKEFVMRIIDKCNIGNIINSNNVLVSSEENVKKPSEQAVLRLVNKLGIIPQQFAFVGNNEVDWVAAYKAKAVPVRLLYPGEYIEEEKNLKIWKKFYEEEKYRVGD